jgi:hypothetical protein
MCIGNYAGAKIYRDAKEQPKGASESWKVGKSIGDALMFAKSRIQGHRFSLTTQKGRSALTVLIPDHVIAALNALPARADVHPDYFFWSGNSKHKSLTGRWQRKLERLNDYRRTSIHASPP